MICMKNVLSVPYPATQLFFQSQKRKTNERKTVQITVQTATSLS